MQTGDAGQSGFTYIGLMILVAMMGIVLASIGVVWRTESTRDKEIGLLFAGDQFRRAIGSYYESSPGIKKFPVSLEDLLVDRRFPEPRRHLRRIYVDPVSGDNRWEIVKGAEEQIIGVYSRSSETPFKQANFAAPYQDFAGARHYSEWRFVYVPDADASRTRKD